MKTADFTFGAILAGETLAARRIDVRFSVANADSDFDWSRVYVEIFRTVCIVFGDVPQRAGDADCPMRVLVPLQHAELDRLHEMSAGGFIQAVAIEGDAVTAKVLATAARDLLLERLRGIAGGATFPPVLRHVKVSIGSPTVDSHISYHEGETNAAPELDEKSDAA